jgi:hypothetical protein
MDHPKSVTITIHPWKKAVTWILSSWVILAACLILLCPVAHARSAATPWTMDQTFQNLVYGASTPPEVVRIVGRYPDEIVKADQMAPAILNYYYFDEQNRATVFVFENNFLVALLYRSASDQYVDLTSFLPNVGDRMINSQILGNTMGYFPNLPMFNPFMMP